MRADVLLAIAIFPLTLTLLFGKSLADSSDFRNRFIRNVRELATAFCADSVHEVVAWENVAAHRAPPQ